METTDRPNRLGESKEQYEWTSPGVSVRKRWLTGLGVALTSVVFFFIAHSEGASMLVSTVIGVIFIGCFVWYLVAVAPTPFAITVNDTDLVRTERGAPSVDIPWASVAKVKEEHFKNGTSVSLTVYKRVGERGLHRAWVVYRDDLSGFDALVVSMRDHMPKDSPWYREQVHD